MSVSTSAGDMSPNLDTNATARQAMWLQAWTMLLSDFIQHEMSLDFVLKPQCQGYHTNQADYQLLSQWDKRGTRVAGHAVVLLTKRSKERNILIATIYHNQHILLKDFVHEAGKSLEMKEKLTSYTSSYLQGGGGGPGMVVGEGDEEKKHAEVGRGCILSSMRRFLKT